MSFTKTSTTNAGAGASSKQNVDSKTKAMFDSMYTKFTKTKPKSKLEQAMEQKPVIYSQLLPEFIRSIIKLLRALSISFPECVATKFLLMELENKNLQDSKNQSGQISIRTDAESMETQNALLYEWNSLLSPYFEEVLAGDYARMFSDLQNQTIFSALSLYAKFYDADLDDNDREALVKMINKINAVCCFYYSIPAKLILVFERLGVSLSQKIEHEMGPEIIDPKWTAEEKKLHRQDRDEEVKKITKEMLPTQFPLIIAELNPVLAELTEEESKSFHQNISLIIKYMDKLPDLKRALKANGIMDMFEQAKSLSA